MTTICMKKNKYYHKFQIYIFERCKRVERIIGNLDPIDVQVLNDNHH